MSTTKYTSGYRTWRSLIPNTTQDISFLAIAIILWFHYPEASPSSERMVALYDPFQDRNLVRSTADYS